MSLDPHLRVGFVAVLSAAAITVAACSATEQQDSGKLDASRSTVTNTAQAKEQYTFTDLRRMVATSTAVVEGTVESVRPGRELGSGEAEPLRLQRATIRITSTHFGSLSSETVIIEEIAWEGTRPLVVNGLRASREGDRGFFFLGPVRETDGGQAYGLINSQGRFLIRDSDKLEGRDVADDQLTARVEGLTPDQLRAELVSARSAIERGEVAKQEPEHLSK